MEQIQQNEIIFTITKEDLQFEAKERLGRELNDEEICIARKGLEFGLLTGIENIYQAIFTEMIGYEKN